MCTRRLLLELLQWMLQEQWWRGRGRRVTEAAAAVEGTMVQAGEHGTVRGRKTSRGHSGPLEAEGGKEDSSS